MNDLKHQQEAKNHLDRWKVGALFMEAGTGKTKVAVDIINASPCDFLLWVAPLRTIGNVRAEIAKWGGTAMPSMFVGVESIGQSDRIYINTVAKLEKHPNAFIVVDESLKIKNFEAKRTKRLLSIGRMAQFKLILNGTPLSRNLLDLWAQMEFLSPKILGMSLAKFKNTFCKYTTMKMRSAGKTYTKEYITDYVNIDYLYSLIRHYVFKADLSLNVSQYYNTVDYEISHGNRKSYDEIKKHFLSDETLEWRNNNIFMEMTTKMQHTYSTDKAKVDAVKGILAGHDPKKVLIFCRFIDSRHLCEKSFPECTVLSYQKSAFGLNLQQYNVTIYFDKVWDYALRIQSTRRTFRTGQQEDCVYYDLTGDVGLERMIDSNIDKKVSLSEYLKKATKKQLEEEL